MAAGGTLLAAHPWIHPPVLRPTGLAAEAATISSLTIDWSGPATGPLPDNYQVVRDGLVVATVPGRVTAYTDKGLAAGHSYSYQVLAIRGGKHSEISQTLTGQTGPPVLRPTGLAVKGKSTGSLTIAWAKPVSGPAPDNYEVVRGGLVVATIPGTAASYTDKALAPDTKYRYQVVAVREGVLSPGSTAVTAQTVKPPLSAARLDGNSTVTFKMESLYPADPKSDKQPGDSWDDVWNFAPTCSSGPCNADLNGTFNGWTISSTLTRSGTTYTGTSKVVAWYCDTESDPMPAILSITITAKSAGAQGRTWAVSSFSGTATLNVSPPADGVCHGDTEQLTVRSK